MVLTEINIANIDDNAIIITVVGYVIVFIALFLLTALFLMIPKIISIFIRRRLRNEGKIEQAMAQTMDVSGELNAAISAALYLYMNELHDDESDVITIKAISKRYSPWSSKIYGLRKLK